MPQHRAACLRTRGQTYVQCLELSYTLAQQSTNESCCLQLVNTTAAVNRIIKTEINHASPVKPGMTYTLPPRVIYRDGSQQSQTATLSQSTH